MVVHQLRPSHWPPVYWQGLRMHHLIHCMYSSCRLLGLLRRVLMLHTPSSKRDAVWEYLSVVCSVSAIPAKSRLCRCLCMHGCGVTAPMLASSAKALHALRACTAAEACWLITSATKACWHMAHPLLLFHLTGPCFLVGSSASH